MEKVKADQAIVYLSLGSNLGNRLQNLQSAVDVINIQAGKIDTISSVYETPPVGFESEDQFLNICLSIQTNLDPHELLVRLQQIEIDLGRTHKSTVQHGVNIYASRTIDIDILFYGSSVLKSTKLMIPHPLFSERKFVLVPLCEIAPKFIDPFSKLGINELLRKCKDTSELHKTNDFLKI